MNICMHCGKETQNKKFCSRSCSASYNNKLRDKKKFFCQKCGKLIGEGEKFNRRKYCDECNPNYIDWTKITLKEIKEKRKYQPHVRIRELAKKAITNQKRFDKCANCGYDKHVEICHVKPINAFDESSTVAEINSLDNLVGLCPNCHWEFDNNKISLNKEWFK